MSAEASPELFDKIVNLTKRRIDVHTQPTGGSYGSVKHYPTGSTLSPLAFSDIQVRVDDLLA